jgi:hypothetical protein
MYGEATVGGDQMMRVLAIAGKEPFNLPDSIIRRFHAKVHDAVGYAAEKTMRFFSPPAAPGGLHHQQQIFLLKIGRMRSLPEEIVEVGIRQQIQIPDPLDLGPISLPMVAEKNPRPLGRSATAEKFSRELGEPFVRFSHEQGIDDAEIPEEGLPHLSRAISSSENDEQMGVGFLQSAGQGQGSQLLVKL